MAQFLKNEPFSNLVDLEDIDNRDFQVIQFIYHTGKKLIECDFRLISDNDQYRSNYEKGEFQKLCDSIDGQNKR